MLKLECPQELRKGFRLYRRREGRDSLGDPISVYDYTQPDLTVEDGAPEGICWQSVRTWQSSRNLSSGVRQEPYGPQETGIVQGVLYGTLEVSVRDRFQLESGWYELRAIQYWPRHRLLQLQKIREEANG